MKFTSKDVDILIVGASTSSLILAAQLLAYGVHPVLVDHRKGLPDTSGLLTLDRISLDILDRLGLYEGLLKGGVETEGLTVQVNEDILGRFDFCRDLHAAKATAFLNIDQVRVDKALLQYLGSQTCPIYWNSNIMKFNENDRGVQMEVGHDGVNYEMRAQWVVFSDISESKGLKQIPIEYKKWSIGRPLYEYSLTKSQADKDEHLILSKKGFTLAKLLDGFNQYKLISTDKGEKAKNLKAQACIASVYSNQRSLFLGDVCFHVFDLVRSSVNIQIQDACNLSWKLALNLLGKINQAVLSSYEEERRPIALKHFNVNYQLLNVLLFSGWIFPNLRQKLVMKSFNKRLHHEEHYRRSSLSLHHSLSKEITAGSRLPNLTIYDEKNGIETSLQEWVQKTGFVLLLIGNLSSNLRFNIGQWVKQKYSSYMQVFYLPYSAKNAHVFKKLEVSAERHRMILVRPDGYIAFINDVLNAGLVDTYMSEILQWRS